MKILQLTKKFPFPLKDGESIAVDSLSRSLVQLGCEVHLLSMNTSKHYVDVDSIRSKIEHYTHVATSFVDNKLTPWAALTNLASSTSYHISRFDYEDFREQLKWILADEDFDIVLMESIYLAPYIDDVRAVTNIPIVMRAHNVEHEIWQRIVQQTTNFLKKWYLRILVQRLKVYELAQLIRIDGLITFTERDLQFFRKHDFVGHGLVAPIGIDTQKYSAKESKENPTVAFIGSLDWLPNTEGLEWFIKKVWPIVLRKKPEAKLHIAGRNPEKSIFKYNSESIIVHGEVPDATAFVSAHAISIVPLLSGGGMRVKILEAMALSRAIVSTKVGAEGIESPSILLADEPQDFAQAILQLLSEPSQIAQVGRQARADVEAKYDSEANGSAVYQFLKMLKK